MRAINLTFKDWKVTYIAATCFAAPTNNQNDRKNNCLFCTKSNQIIFYEI